MYDLTSQRVLAGAAGAGAKLYVEDVFSTWLYTGNGSTQTITNGIDLSGKGGLVWIKSRLSSIRDHRLFDTARGTNTFLASNTTDQQQTSGGTLTAFNSSGFDIGAAGAINTSADTYASWTFRKAAKFFDVVTWVGDGTSSRNISHSLGSTPGFIIVKRTDSTSSWWCWHRSISTGDLSGNNLIVLNTTAAQTNIGTLIGTASSTTFQVGGDSSVNASGGTYVAYLFAHDAGGFGDSGSDSVVKCGSYTGNGSSNGPQVDLSWEPQWVMIKRTSGAGGWYIYDNMRGVATGGVDANLVANSSQAEDSSFNYLDFNATGFKLATTSNDHNGNGDTYIYIAIRRGPMKTPTDATKVFSANTWTGTGTTQQITTGFFPDACLTIDRNKNATNLNYLFDNLRGVNVESYTNSTAAEGADSGKAFTMTGLSNNSGNLNSTLGVYVGEFFRRAPGFFDVVAYTGTQSGSGSQVVKHSLGVAPELLIHKQRNSTGSWFVHALFTASNSKQGTLNSTTNFNTSTYATNDVLAAQPTSSQVEFGFPYASTPNTFIAYLFASCPGVSKVGNYTGTGTTLQVNCGFTSGARFVLIKRTDSTGDWYVWDSARGIVAGNDPYLLLNSTAAEVTGTDYVDTYSAGFEISSTAPAAINANGGSFIFLAVA